VPALCGSFARYKRQKPPQAPQPASKGADYEKEEEEEEEEEESLFRADAVN